MARTRRSPNEPRAVVAAATRVQLNDRRLAKRQAARRQQWQDDAWEYFDLFGFVKQALWLQANSLAKARIFVAVANPDDPDGDPIPVDDETSPVPAEVAAQAIAELARLTGPLGGLPEILREMDLNLEVPGEGYLVGYGVRPEQRDPVTQQVTVESTTEFWEVRSTSEVQITGDGQYRVRDDPNERSGVLLDPEFDTCIRFWLPHPRYSKLPDSPMRGELEDFETLLILSRQRRGEAKSRLPGGLLLIDSNITATAPVKSEQDSGTNTGTGDVVLDAIADAISDAIEDDSSAAGQAPVTLRVNVPVGGTVADMVAKVDMSRSSDQWLDGRIERLIESVARGLNYPVESVMGHQQTTFANAAQVDEDKFYDHTEPRLLLIVDLVTNAFLRPQLLAPDERGAPAPAVFGEWAPKLFVWYDPSAIIGKPDRTAMAGDAHDRVAISDSAYRAATGFSEDDAPDAIEVLIRTAMQHGKIGGDFTKALLDLLGVTVKVNPGEAGDISGQPPTPDATAQYRRLAELLIERDDLTPAVAAPVAALHALETAIPASARPVGQPSLVSLGRAARQNPGRRLMDIDRDLRTRLLVLCSTTMTRTLERAGNRAKQQLPEARALVRRVDPHMVVATLGPTILAAGGVDSGDLLDGAFDAIEDQFMRWGAGAQREALDLAASLGSGLSTAQREQYGLRQAEDLTEAWQWLKEQLTTQAHARMFDPHPAVPPGEFDPDLAVPPGMVRQAITRAGGTIGVETKGDGDSWVAMRSNGGPAGGIGTGEVVRDALGASGNSVEAYQWVYGPAMRKHPFEPHADLDGTVFRNFDDDSLANDAGWPDVAFYFPGDHDGCVCDFEPIVVDASELAVQTDQPQSTLDAPRDAYPGDLSTRQAAEWLSDHWGSGTRELDFGAAGTTAQQFDRFFDLTGLGADSANAAASAIDDLLDEFPRTASHVDYFGSSAPVTKQVAADGIGRLPKPSGQLADASEVGRSIRLSTNQVKNLDDVQATLVRNHEAGFLSSDNGLQHVVDHEFGHHVMFEAHRAAVRAGENIYTDIEQVFADLTGERPGTAEFARARYELTRTAVSRYAAQNVDELAAESFAMVRAGAPSPLARAIYDLLVRYAEGVEA